MATWDAVKLGLKYTAGPFAYFMVEQGEKAAKEISDAAKKGIGPLEEEAAKQTIKMQLDQQRARIEQELAIARRIDNAEEVEIEEFYDTSGKGSAGLTADMKSETATIGLSAEGRRVTKRVYHFKGWRSPDTEDPIVTGVES